MNNAATKNFSRPLFLILLLLGLGFCRVVPAYAQETPYAVIAVAYSPNSNLIASSDEIGMIKLWNAKTGQVLRTLGQYESPAYNLSFSPDSKMLAIAFINEIKLINLDKNTLENTIKHGIASIAFSPDGKSLASGSWGIGTSAYDRSVCLWDVKTGKLRFILKGHRHSVTSVNYSPDGTQLVSADKGGIVKLWDTKTNSLLLTWSKKRDYKRATAVFTAEGKLIAAISENFYSAYIATPSGTRLTRTIDETVELWDVRKDTLLQKFNAHKNGARSLAISPNGNLLATAGHLDAVKLWDVKTGEMIKHLASPEQEAFSLAFSPHNKYLVVGFRAVEQIKIWNVE